MTTTTETANTVEYFPPKPNPMFTPGLTALLRFARYSLAVPCVECGKKKKNHWTMLCPFHATSPREFVLEKGPLRQPGDPCCTDHPLAPAIPDALIGCGGMEVPDAT